MHSGQATFVSHSTFESNTTCSLPSSGNAVSYSNTTVVGRFHDSSAAYLKITNSSITLNEVLSFKALSVYISDSVLYGGLLFHFRDLVNIRGRAVKDSSLMGASLRGLESRRTQYFLFVCSARGRCNIFLRVL